MTQNARQEVLAVLAEAAALAPDVRLGQLIAFVGFMGESQVGRTLWDMEDDELLAALQQHRADLLGRIADVPGPAEKQPAGA